MNVLETDSRLGKRIRLTEVQWDHIAYKHKEIIDQIEKIKQVLEDPDTIYFSPSEDNYQYCKLYRETPVTEKYLLLVVKHLNGEGFVITAFFVSRIKVKGKVQAYAKEDIH